MSREKVKFITFFVNLVIFLTFISIYSKIRQKQGVTMKHKNFFFSDGKINEKQIGEYIGGDTKNVFNPKRLNTIRKNISNSQSCEYSDAWARLYDVTVLGAICSINGIDIEELETLIKIKDTLKKE